MTTFQACAWAWINNINCLLNKINIFICIAEKEKVVEIVLDQFLLMWKISPAWKMWTQCVSTAQFSQRKWDLSFLQFLFVFRVPKMSFFEEAHFIIIISTRAREKKQDLCTINDPLGQTQSPASSDIYCQLKVVLFWKIFKSDGRTDRQNVRK